MRASRCRDADAVSASDTGTRSSDSPRTGAVERTDGTAGGGRPLGRVAVAERSDTSDA